MEVSFQNPFTIISIYDVYNLPLYEDHLVIDCRNSEDFEKEHIATAFNIPPPEIQSTLSIFEQENTRNRHLLTHLQLLLERGLPEFVSPIVLYGGLQDTVSSSSFVKTHILWIADRFSKLSSQPLISETSDSSDRLQFILDSQRRLARAKICIMEGGYESFKAEFPLLCGLIKDMMPLPCAIEPGIFLGSRNANSLERRKNGQLGIDFETIRKLGIGAIVVNASMPMIIEDTNGLNCLRCPVNDSDTENMGEIWNVAVDFINQMRNLGVKVLVQVHGRSRSASFLVAWAIKTKGMNVENALNYVTSKCFYQLDKDLMYLDQLSSWKPQPTLTYQNAINY